MLREKINSLISQLKETGDNESANDIDEIIRSCGSYIERVNAMESCISVLRYTLEPEDYRARLVELDKARKITHNAVIANIKLLNRYCKLAQVSLIYEGDLESRIEIAEFAKKLVDEMFETRKM